MRLRGKRFLAAVLAAAVMTSGALPFAVFAEQQDEKTATMYLQSSFNTEQTGGSPSGWTSQPKSGKISVSEMPSDTDKSMRYEAKVSSANKDMFAQKTFDISEKQIVLDFQIWFERLDIGQFRLQLRDGKEKEVVPITISNGQVMLFDGTNLGKCCAGKFYRISLAFDFDAETMNVWFNEKHKAYNCSLRGLMQDLALVRLHLTSIANEGSVYFDDIYLYGGKKPMELDDGDDAAGAGGDAISDAARAAAKKRAAVALYENRNNAFVRGKQTKIDANPAVVPFTEDGVTYVPLSFLAQSFGGVTSWRPEDGSAVITYNGKTYVVSDKTTEITGGDTQIAAERLPRVIEGRYFVPLGAACRIFAKQLFWDDCGLAVLSDEADFLSWDRDLDIINDIVKSFIYDEYEGAELIARLREKNPNNAHPRIMATEETFAEIAERIKADTDPVVRNTWADILARADKYLTEPMSTYVIPDGIRLLSTSRQVLDRVMELSFVYNITGDERYAQRAWMELYAAALFPDWNPYHFLDVGEMCAAFAIGYDWLYDYLSADQRQIVRTAIINYGFQPLMDDIEQNERNRTWDWLNGDPNNWIFVCLGGETMAALAIGDEPEAEALAGTVLENSLTKIERGLSLFAPIGQWMEGILYWDYTMQYMAYFIHSLDTAMGTDFGRFDVPGIRTTADYVRAMNGSIGTFNFSDADLSDVFISDRFLWLGKKLGQPALAEQLLEKLRSGATNEIAKLYRTASGGTVETLIWYDPDYFSGGEATESELDRYIPVIETATMRSGWEESSIYVGFHNGSNADPHSHLDTGSFILDADGERFFLDLGRESYNLAGGYNRYRYRAEGHNCLVINPDGGYDQPLDASAKITKFETKPRGAFAVSDLTDAYRGDAASVMRGVMLTDDRGAVIVQDEVSLKSPSEIYWFAHTQADIAISEDGKSAILTQSGKRLYAEILSGEGAGFTVMKAEPLPTTPAVAGQNSNAGRSKLTIHLTDYAGGTISVGFAPLAPEENNYPFSPVTPIAEWSIAEGELKRASISGITIDGKPLEGFSPNRTHYTYYVPFETEHVPVVQAEGAAQIAQANSTLKGTASIKAAAKDTELPRTYYITFQKERRVGVPENMTKLRVASVEASQVPQPENGKENILDNDYTTRWAADGNSWIECDLGSVETVNAVGVAFMRGNERTANLQIELSADGEVYRSIFDGKSSGTTLEQEVYAADGMQARYVRLRCDGTSEGSWTSVTEVAVYGK